MYGRPTTIHFNGTGCQYYSLGYSVLSFLSSWREQFQVLRETKITFLEILDNL